ncbi:MAG: hypothetical protein HYS98_02915 [Deltaproteobacteria bacterium]|nr:hypothetical protein [Deltaproteobacteria bacterium]
MSCDIQKVELPRSIAPADAFGKQIQNIEMSVGATEKIYPGTYDGRGNFLGMAYSNVNIQNIQFSPLSTLTSSSRRASSILEIERSGCITSLRSGLESVVVSGDTLKGHISGQASVAVRPNLIISPPPEFLSDLDATKTISIDQWRGGRGNLITLLGHDTTHVGELLLVQIYPNIAGQMDVRQRTLSPQTHLTQAVGTTITRVSYEAPGITKIPHDFRNLYVLSYEYVEHTSTGTNDKIKLGFSFYDFERDTFQHRTLETRYEKRYYELVQTFPLFDNGETYFVGIVKRKAAQQQPVTYDIFISDTFSSHETRFSTLPFSNIFGLAQGLEQDPQETLKIMQDKQGNLRLLSVVDQDRKLWSVQLMGSQRFTVNPSVLDPRTQAAQRIVIADKNHFDAASGSEHFAVAYYDADDLKFMLSSSSSLGGTLWSEPIKINPLGVVVDKSFKPVIGLSQGDQTAQVLWKNNQGQFYLSTNDNFTKLNSAWDHRPMPLGSSADLITLHTSVCGGGFLSFRNAGQYKLIVSNSIQSIEFSISNAFMADNILSTLYEESLNVSRFLSWKNQGGKTQLYYTYY